MSTAIDRAGGIEAFVLDVDGVLTDGQLHYGPEGESLKSFHARDGLGLALLRETGMKLAIVSGRDSPLVAARAKELRIAPCWLGRLDKGKALEELCEHWGILPRTVAAMGDDLVDVPMLRRVGLSFAPADADARVRATVHCVVKSRGGFGAVRDACEILLEGRGHWTDLARRFELEDRT